MTSTMRARPILGLLLALLCSTANGFHGVAKESQLELSKALERAPLADPFKDLKGDAKKGWAKEASKTINETIRQFLAIPVLITIEVRLVGFDGGSYQHMRVSPPEMRSYLHALRAEMDTVVLQPHLAAMPVYPQFQWIVSHDTTHMIDTLNNVLKHEAAHSAGRTTEQHQSAAVNIHYKSIDDIIAHDVTRHGGVQLTIYILNLNAGIGKYAYRYLEGSEEQPGYCAGTHYVSASQGPLARYLWWDITAGPISYGPGLRQKGHVFEHSMPHPGNFKPETLPAALVPQLASTAWSAVQHLVWPPLQHSGVHFKTHIIIQVIHIHERLSHSNEKFNRAVIEDTLKNILGDQQIVEVHETWLPMASCPLCVEAYTSSLKMRTARDEGSTLLMAQSTQVLDAPTMHRLLTRYMDGIYGHAGVGFELQDNHRVLPVFVWDVRGASDPILFTGGLQAVAFPDMVMAVSSRVGLYSTAATCGFTQMVADSYDVTRPVLAAVLEAGWGIANTSTHYTPTTGVGSNHMWSVSSTPWGSLSASMQVSAPVRTLLARNMALAHLNSSASRLVTLLSGFAKLSRNGKFDLYAVGDQKDRIVTRFNLAAYKVEQAMMYMGQTDYWRGLMYARSIDHDLQHLNRMALKVARSTRATLKCKSGPSLASVWWAPAIALVLWPTAWLLRSKLYAKKFDKLA